jgi:hypothetical protein
MSNRRQPGMDRNDMARAAFAMQQRAAQMDQAMIAFLQAFDRGQAKVLDRVGRPIEPGTLVMYRPPFDPIFTVVEAEPVKGLIKLTLTVTMPYIFNANQQEMSMMVVGNVGEDGGVVLAQPPFVPVPAGGDGTADGGGGEIDPPAEPPTAIDPLVTDPEANPAGTFADQLRENLSDLAADEAGNDLPAITLTDKD